MQIPRQNERNGRPDSDPRAVCARARVARARAKLRVHSLNSYTLLYIVYTAIARGGLAAEHVALNRTAGRAFEEVREVACGRR
jgi:hypothetical protein